QPPRRQIAPPATAGSGRAWAARFHSAGVGRLLQSQRNGKVKAYGEKQGSSQSNSPTGRGCGSAGVHGCVDAGGGGLRSVAGTLARSPQPGTSGRVYRPTALV